MADVSSDLKSPLEADVSTTNDADGVPNNSRSPSMMTWSPEEERRVIRKMDMAVMPLLVLNFFCLQIDRGNIGNALTDNFLRDIGINQDHFNVGQQLVGAGIVLIEIPSNMILYRIGPKAWMSGQIMAWSMIAIFQAFQKGLAAYLSTRLLLGLCEGGFIPGSLYVISTWYTSAELSKRYCIFFMGNMTAIGVSGIIAYGILQMRGIAGLAGWQWLFILEGIFSVLMGILFMCFFPGLMSNPVPWSGIRYFSDREIQILRERKVRDDRTKVKERGKISGRDVRDTISDWKLWSHIVLQLIAMAPATAYSSYAPLIITSFGYDALKSNAMSSIGLWLSSGFYLLAGYVADRCGRRGLVVLVCLFIEFIFVVTFKCLTDSTSAGTKFAVLTGCMATMAWWHPVNGSWIAINAKSAPERSIRMALYSMATNTGAIVGSQTFRADDRPYYHRGWTLNVSYIATGLACTIFAMVQYTVLNKRMKKEVSWKRITKSRVRYRINLPPSQKPGLIHVSLISNEENV